MTTFQLEESQPLADALTQVIHRLGSSYGAVEAAAEMRSAATPGNGYHVAQVPWAVRPAVAVAMRSVAAEGHPLAAQLEGLAAGLSEQPPHLR